MQPWLALFILVAPLAMADDPDPAPLLAQVRAGQDLPPPVRDPRLDRLCALRAAELAGLGALSHDDAEGRGPGLQALASGYPPGLFGEVLGTGPDLEQVWRAWLASPPHRSVLLQAGWTRWGAGWARRGAAAVWVLRFWQP